MAKGFQYQVAYTSELSINAKSLFQIEPNMSLFTQFPNPPPTHEERSNYFPLSR